MGDLVYLSLWLRDFRTETMLRYWKSALEEFPCSPELSGVRSVAIYPLDWGQTPLLEQAFSPGVDAEAVVRLAQEFLHADCAYEAQMNWNLWVASSDPHKSGWQKIPQVVSVACVGSGFDTDAPENRGDIQINFGLDTPLLPPEPENVSVVRPIAPPRPVQENIQQLLDYVHRLETKLPLLKKLLWCESGENLAEKIQSVWNLKTQ